VTDGVKFINRTMFCTDQDKVPSHIAIYRYLVITYLLTYSMVQSPS